MAQAKPNENNCKQATKASAAEAARIEERIKETLKLMTVNEKIDLFHAAGKFTSLGVPRLGIRQLNHSDGPHGVRAEVDWNSWGTANWTNDSIVAFPALSCLAATWNQEMSALYGDKISEEFAFRNKDLLLGPGVSLVRNPLCGRNFEYMGEDPYLAGEMAWPYIVEVQKNGVGCCLKHFFLNNQETDRFEYNANVSERAVREIYLPAFKKCVDYGVWTIMGSYNKWLNTHCSHNNTLLNDILKKEWGFDGAVVSDWGGCHSTEEAIYGGLDIEMGSFTNGKSAGVNGEFENYYMAHPMKVLAAEGKIPMEVIDEKASRVLRTIFRTSMNPNRIIGKQCSQDHYDAALRIGEEGIVLLKNEKNILPIQPEKYNKILIVGENATRDLSKGGGSSELKTKGDVFPLDEFKAVYGDKIDYAQGYQSGELDYDNEHQVPGTVQEKLFKEAVEKAKTADLIIFIGGLNKNKHQDCEGADRKGYGLSFGQNELITALANIQKNIVVVNNGGSAYETPWLDKIQGLVHIWYLGSMGGRAMVNILSGKVCPSGKLPISWAKKLDDYYFMQFGKEAFPGVDKQVYYKDDIYVGYRHFDTHKVKPQFPFGYGLSYTTFKYGKPVISAKTMTADQKLTVSVDVTNTGNCAGKEIVQLYIGDPKCTVDRPTKELKGFKKLDLQPGETKTATFEITEEMLQYWSEAEHKFVSEPGVFKAYIAASVEDVKGMAEFKTSVLLSTKY